MQGNKSPEKQGTLKRLVPPETSGTALIDMMMADQEVVNMSPIDTIPDKIKETS